MSDELSIQDRERAEKIYNAVEAQLKFRYGWIGLITAALIGGGAYTVISGLTASAKEELNKATYVISEAEKELDELGKRSSSMSDDLQSKRDAIEKLQDSLAQFQAQEAATNEQFATMRENIASNIALLEEANATVRKVIAEVEQKTGTKLLAATASLEALTKNVDQANVKLQNGEYRIYLHTGGAKALGNEFLSNVASTLRYNGFTVMGSDEQWDKVGGSGVDYFVEQDLPVAQAVANAINSILPKGAPQVQPRFQKAVRDQQGTLGLWL